MRDESALRSPAPARAEGRWPAGRWPRAARIPVRRPWRHVTHRRSSWRAHQPTHAHEIVRGPDQERVQLGARDPAEACLAQAPGGLRPPEDLLHALPAALAHGKTPVPQRAAIEPRDAMSGDRRHVGPDAALPQVANEGARMVALVRAERRGPHALARLAREQRGRRSALGGAGQGLPRSEEHTSELQSLAYLVCRLLLEKKNTQ